MLFHNKRALVCDFAQYYHIFDVDKLDIVYFATLAVGLSPKARIYKSLSEQKLDLEIMILAGIFDRLNLLLYGFLGKKGQEMPERLLDRLMGKVSEDDKKANDKKLRCLYTSGKEFEDKRNELIKRIGGNNG